TNNYFANAGYDNTPLHALKNGVSGGNGVYLYGAGGFPNQSFSALNYWVDVLYANDPGGTFGPPVVTSVSPPPSAIGVLSMSVTATFDQAMDPSSITSGTFTLRDAANNLVPATLTYDSNSTAATLIPTGSLASGTTYTATITGGSGGVRSLPGIPM